MLTGICRFSLVCAGLLLSLVNTGWAQRPVEELLPKETVLYARFEGLDAHRQAFQETAAAQVFQDSGLSELFDRLLATIGSQEGAGGFPIAVQHVIDNGVSIAIAVDPPQPGPLAAWGVVVVPGAGEGVDLLADLIDGLKEEKLKVLTTRVQGRFVKYVQVPDAPVDLGWWKEEEHLVFAFGMNAIASAIAVADGKRPHLAEHDLFQKYSEIDSEFDVAQVYWFDFRALREMFGNAPVPIKGKEETVPLSAILEALGLDSLEHVAAVCGYRGPSLWTEIIVEAPGERTGLLSLMDQPSFTIEDLPAIPLQHAGVWVTSFDWGPGLETILQVVRDLIAFNPGEELEELNSGLEKFEQTFGFAPQTLFNSLGSINCVYLDRGQGMFGLGSVAIVQVKDLDTLLDCAGKIIAVVETEREKKPRHVPTIRKAVRENDTLIRIDPPKFSLFFPTISIDENWLIFGLLPQAVEAQRMRMSGEIFSWSLETDLADALELLPEEMTSLTVCDPAAGYRELLGIAPIFLAALEEGLRDRGELAPGQKLPIDVSDFPPAEKLTEPLFLNVSVSTVDDVGLQCYSRRSVPTFLLIGEREPVSPATRQQAISRFFQNLKSYGMR